MYRWFKGPLVLSFLLPGTLTWAQEGGDPLPEESVESSSEDEAADSTEETVEETDSPDGASPANEPNIQSEELDENEVDVGVEVEGNH